MMRMTCAGLLVLGLIAPAAAAPRAKAAHPPGAIDVANQRKVVLTSFTLSTGGDDGKLVGKLDKPVAPGGKARIKVAAKGCEFVARWQFEDASDEAQVNLCHDPKIVLTD